MTELEIEQILAKLENDKVELKADLHGSRQQEEKQSLFRTFTAFYNTKGGVIIFGIKDKVSEILGVPDPQQLEHGFLQMLKTNVVNLDISPEIEITDYKGRKLVIVHCPKGPRPPYIIKGYLKPFIRDGSMDVEASDEQIAQMYRDRSQEPQDRYIIENSNIEDLDIDGAVEYLKKTCSHEVASDEVEVALLNEGLLGKKANGIYKPTIAGLLLFGKKPQKFLPHAVIKADSKADDEKNDWDDMQTLSGTIFDQIRDAESFIRRNIKVAAKIVGFRRIETPAIPLEAMREAIVNAVVHRDYHDTAAEIHLRVRDMNTSVLNPGGIMAPLTIELVMKGNFAPRSRNDTIALALIRMGGFMEKRGTGIMRIKRLMREAGLPEPEFLDEAGTFKVVFRTSLKKDRSEIKKKIVIDEEEFNRLKLDESHLVILELIEREGAVGPSEIEKSLGKSRPFVINKLNELLTKEVLMRTTENKYDPNIRYQLHSRFVGNDMKPGGKLQTSLDI